MAPPVGLYERFQASKEDKSERNQTKHASVPQHIPVPDTYQSMDNKVYLEGLVSGF